MTPCMLHRVTEPGISRWAGHTPPRGGAEEMMRPCEGKRPQEVTPLAARKKTMLFSAVDLRRAEAFTRRGNRLAALLLTGEFSLVRAGLLSSTERGHAGTGGTVDTCSLAACTGRHHISASHRQTCNSRSNHRPGRISGRRSLHCGVPRIAQMAHRALGTSSIPAKPITRKRRSR